MKLIMTAIRDSKTDQFDRPMFTISVGQAVRSFADAVNRQEADNMLYQHPEDYELFEIGIFDTDTAGMEVKKPASVALASNFKR